MALDLGINTLGTQTHKKDIFASLAQTKEISDIIIASGQNLARGAMLGKQTIGAFDAVTAEAGAGNTGNGVLTLADPAHAVGVKAGVYKVVFVQPVTDLGSFVVEDPDGIIIGSGVVGTAFDGVVKFTIADGLTDFVAGDSFNITVAYLAGNNKYYLWNPTATNGVQNLVGILGCAVDATTGDEGGFCYVEGEFLLSTLTAAAGVTITAGVYNGGSIVIKKETD
ncbi:MAG: head decoration protein [Candidatus Kapabacteria bacterium]|nr:head decoration protein [Candidatus Kapabacteria bacterium]